MNLKTALWALPLLLLPMKAFAAPLLLGDEENAHISVNNRIVAKVNGKAISVVDLMKKMDLLFYREFPQYAASSQARFQFYQANWKYILQEMVEKELILADAEENKLVVSAGDIRQEMETLFGPNIISNLDKIGMTFDEASKIILGDITIQRMLYIRVQGKALRNVTPLQVRTYYEEFAKENVQPDQWIYQVISIRNKNAAQGATIAHRAHQLLTEESLPLENLQATLLAISDDKTRVNVSEEFHHDEKAISQEYREILSPMAPQSYSKPIALQSRATKETVFRLFFLKEMIPGGTPPYAKVEHQLKNQLVDKIISAESKAYINRLRKHFDVQETVPENFAPFSLH